jgi:hypothetical protein
MRRFLLLSLIVFSFLDVSGQCGRKCGVVRWPVKTLSDTTVNKIDFKKFVNKPKTVSWLVNAEPPEKRPQDSRVNGLEWFAFKIKAVLVGYKLSNDDQDFHVVVKDLTTDETMIVEFSDPKCSGVCNSKYVRQIKKARNDFINSPAVKERGKVTGTYKELKKRVVVEVIGTGFWDFKHGGADGQTGVAKNAFELHPVIGYREIN